MPHSPKDDPPKDDPPKDDLPKDDPPKNDPYWEGSQFLLETEPIINPVTGKKRGYQYTEAAAKAQIRRWKRLMRNRPPQTTITSDMLADGYNAPPTLFYGWPFNDDYLVDYAKRHRISIEVDAKQQEMLGCPTLEFNFADVTEAHYERKNVVRFLQIMARITVLPTLMRATGQWLRIGRPFSLKYSKILYMWTNYNIDEKCDDLGRPDRYDKVIAFLDKAMNECLPEGKKAKLQWWWSWDDNDVSVLQNIE